jgi:hypothetical protein
MITPAEMINKGGSMGNDAQNDAPLHRKKTEMASGNFSQLDYATEEKDNKHIGDYTIKTRNFKIADAIAEYLITTPKAKL